MTAAATRAGTDKPDGEQRMPTALVIGASRGLGLEFTRQYRAAGWDVLATVRDATGRRSVEALGATALALDVADPGSVALLDDALGERELAVALYAAGIIHRANAQAPPRQADFDALMHTNVLGAMQILPLVGPRVAAARGVLGFLSSGQGLIGNASGSNSWLYRVSKAALNMAVASARSDYPGATLVLLDPGWVRTDMGGASAPLTAEQSVHDLRRLIARLTPADSGRFFHHDGRRTASW